MMTAGSQYRKINGAAGDGISILTMPRAFRLGIRRYVYGAASLILCFLVFRWLSRPSSSFVPSGTPVGYRGEVMSRPSIGSSPGNVVRLEVFMESQCPDTTRFVRTQLTPSWKNLASSGRVELTLIPFGKARCQETDNGDFDCKCQHGPNECILNQLMNCVIEQIGHPEVYYDTITCIQSLPNLDSALQKCIAPNDKLSVDKMHQCASGPHGRRLLAVSGTKTAALSPKLDFVPWIMLDGVRVVDALYALQENLCKMLEPAPIACHA